MKTSASFRGLRYSGVILGVDLGSHTVKVMHLKVAGGRAAVSGYAQTSVWEKLAEAKNDEERRQIYIDALRGAVKASKFKSNRAALALSGSHSIVRFLTLPKDYKRDARTGLPEEAKALSPFDPQDTLMDVRFFSDALTVERLEAMAVFAQRQPILESFRIIQKSRLRPAVIINDALALENAYNFAGDAEEHEPVVLVNLGAATTSVNIVENGALRTVRTFNIGGDVFTRAIKREMGLSLAEAENLKCEYGLFGHRLAEEARLPAGKSEAHRIYNETSVKVYRAIKPMFKDLCDGVTRTIDSFTEKRVPGLPPISKILVAGGGAALNNLREVMRLETGLPVEIFEPQKGAADSSAARAVVFGLALSGALRKTSSAPRLNLLPIEAKRAATMRNSLRMVMYLGLVVAMLFGVRELYLEQHRRMEEREAALELQRIAAKKAGKPVPKDGKPAPPPKPALPYAYLGRLRITGVFGDTVMLTGGGRDYTAQNGRLIDDGGNTVKLVSSLIQGKKLILRAGAESYTLEMPK